MPNPTTSSRLVQLHDAGQSIWLDYIDRTMLHNGELARRIRDDSLTGMTSNPTIFEKALAQGTAYDEQLKDAAGDRTATGQCSSWSRRTTCGRHATFSVRSMMPPTGATVSFRSRSLPASAHDSAATIAEARRLWKTVARPNVMIKVPGTPEGAVAVRALIADGINVNITLLFSIDAHRVVIDAYLAGLEDRVKAGERSTRGSRRELLCQPGGHRGGQAARRAVQRGRQTPTTRTSPGKAAIANAKLAYRLFRERFAGPRWDALAARGAGAAAALGEHEHQESRLSRRDVRRAVDRPGHREHDAAGDDRGVSRSRRTVARTVDADLAGERKAMLRDLEAAGVSLAGRHRAAPGRRASRASRSRSTRCSLGSSARRTLLAYRSRSAAGRRDAAPRVTMAGENGYHGSSAPSPRIRAPRSSARMGPATATDDADRRPHRRRHGCRPHQLLARHARRARAATIERVRVGGSGPQTCPSRSLATSRGRASALAIWPRRSRSQTGDELVLAPEAHAPTGDVPVTYDALARDVQVGDRILVNDGLLEFDGPGGARAPRGRRGSSTAAAAQSHKGHEPARRSRSRRRRSRRRMPRGHRVCRRRTSLDYLALSFVRRAEDICGAAGTASQGAPDRSRRSRRTCALHAASRRSCRRRTA